MLMNRMAKDAHPCVPCVSEVIVVEGKYDKQAVLRAVDALVVETRGFGIFKDTEKRIELKRLAERQGLIILTDSDGAGQVIRSHLKSFIDPAHIKQAFIPDVSGTERRKAIPSKECKLGVEAMAPDVITVALERAGATIYNYRLSMAVNQWTNYDLYAFGLTGTPGAKERREALQHRLGLPQRMSSRDLCRVLHSYTHKDVKTALETLDNEHTEAYNNSQYPSV
jgi:ribonuclease M5